MDKLLLVALLSLSAIAAISAFVMARRTHGALERHHPGFCEAMRPKGRRRR